MHKASLLFIFEPNPGLESSMSTLRSGPRRPRSPGPRAPSRAFFMRLQACTHLHPVDLLQIKLKRGAYFPVPLVYTPERLRLSAQWAAYGIILFYSHL